MSYSPTAYGSLISLWTMASLAALFGFLVFGDYKNARLRGRFYWMFWWQGSIFFPSLAGWQFSRSISSAGWSDHVNSVLGPRYSPDFAPGGVLYAKSHAEYLVGVHEVLWVGLFMSLAFFSIPVAGYFYGRWRQRSTGSASPAA